MPDKKAYQALPLPTVPEPRAAPPSLRPVLLREPPSPRWPWVVEYPDEDGEPMTDNDWQGRTMDATYEALKWHFESAADVYVGKNLQFYYEEGNPNQALAPDVFVARGVAAGFRTSYRIWEEGQPPDFVLEFVGTRSSPRLGLRPRSRHCATLFRPR